MQQIKDFNSKAGQILENLKKEFALMRSDQANPGLIENILVEYYGEPTPLKQVGSISVLDAKTLVIHPWTKDTIPAIEQAIIKQGKGLSVQSESSVVRVIVPVLSTERRMEIVRQINEKAEHARIAVRRIRDKFREQVKLIQAQDEKFRILKDLDEAAEHMNEQIQELRKNKEKQVLE